MRQEPELDRVQARMQPGELTLRGFLGADHRKLVDIVAQDGEAVGALGLRHDRVADRLLEIMEKGRDMMEREVLVEGRYNVHVRDDRGRLPSPWGDGLFGKGDAEMVDTVTGRRFRWNELTLHMIRAHGFYGGKGSEYRIEPRDIAEVLTLGPERGAES